MRQIQELVSFLERARHWFLMDNQVPYLKDANQHDFGHTIHQFRFAADLTPEKESQLLPKEMKTRRKLGIDDPLRGLTAGTDFGELLRLEPVDTLC